MCMSYVFCVSALVYACRGGEPEQARHPAERLCALLGVLDYTENAPLPGRKRGRGDTPVVASQGETDPSLHHRGLARGESCPDKFRFNGQTEIVKNFQAACRKHDDAWQDARDLCDTLQTLTNMVQEIFKLVAVGTSGPLLDGPRPLDELMAKFVSGCSSHGMGQAAFLKSSLQELPAHQMQKYSLAPPGVLMNFPESWTAAQASNFIFDRDDFAIYLGIFPRLWGDVFNAWPGRSGDIFSDGAERCVSEGSAIVG